MAKLFANSGDPDQTPHFAASDLVLHCLPITPFGVSNRVNKYVPIHVVNKNVPIYNGYF